LLLIGIASIALTSSGSGGAKRLFAESEQKLRAAKSLSGRLVGKGAGFGSFRSTFLLKKPRSFRVVNGLVDIYYNGKVQFNHLVRENEYFSPDISKGGAFGAPCGLDAFFGQSTGDTAPYFVKRTEFRIQKVDGRACAAKALHFESFGRDDRMVFYVDVARKMPIGWDQVFGNTNMHYRFVDLRFNVPVAAAAFDWKPMPGLKERVIKRSSHR